MYQIQNLNQTSASRLNLNFKILTKRCIRISIEIQLLNLNQTAAAKYFSFKISSEHILQNLDQTLCSKSEQRFSFMTKLQRPNLHKTVVNTFLNNNISNSNNFNEFKLASSHARVTSFKSNKHYGESESVSDKGSQ